MLRIGYAKSAPDEGSASAEKTPHPSRIALRLMRAALSHKGRGEVPGSTYPSSMSASISCRKLMPPTVRTIFACSFS